MTAVINDKISLLYDFCILTMRQHQHDPGESRVREMFKSCKTEDEMQRTIRGVLFGTETLEQLLARKGY